MDQALTAAPRRHRLKLAISLFAAATCCLPGTASAKDEVTVKLTASKVIVAVDAAKETLVPADAAKPGDVIEYSAVYRNETGGQVKGLEATVPIPAGLELLADSAKPAGPLASTDGKAFAAQPLMTRTEGKSVPVPLTQYRALRWTIPQLAAGAEVTVSLRARVLTNLPQSKKP